jgi:signal transduction histidine kinase
VDTNKIYALIELSELMKDTNPVQAYRYGFQAINIARADGDYNSLMHALHSYTILLNANGYLDSSRTYTEEYLLLAQDAGDLQRTAESLQEYGNVLRRLGETDTAYRCYLKSIQYYNQMQDTLNLISCYNSMGTIHRIRTDYDSASYYYLMAIDFSEKINYEKGMIAPLINMGKVSTYTRDYDKSMEYSLRSLEITRSDSNIRLMAIAYANLGVNEYEQNHFESAKEYYEIALRMNQRINNLLGINNMYNNLGTVYHDMGEFEKALDNYNKAYKTFKAINYRSGMTSALINMAGILAEMGQYDRAAVIYDTCLLLTGESGDLVKRAETLESLYRTYRDAGEYRLAMEYLAQFHEINDSIYRLEKEKIIADYTMKYEKERDQARILLLENSVLERDLAIRKRTNQRNIYLFVILGLLPTTIFLLAFLRNKAHKDRIIADQKIRQLEEEKKLLAAKSIVDGQENERKRIAKELHDGLGVLLSAARMQFTTLRDKSPENTGLIDRAAKLLEQAAGDVRKISHNMMPGLLTKYGFFEAVEDLFERLDETENMNLTCTVNGNTGRMPENTEIMLYRIIQELVNNTFKHAEASTITLTLKVVPVKLSVHYKDDGKGFILEEKRESRSLGLSSIESRVNFLNGSLTVDTAPGRGTTYDMQFPIELLPQEDES